MKKSQLRKIIREAIDREVSRNAAAEDGGTCRQKKKCTDYHLYIGLCQGTYHKCWSGNKKCKNDSDCADNCWCDK